MSAVSFFECLKIDTSENLSGSFRSNMALSERAERMGSFAEEEDKNTQNLWYLKVHRMKFNCTVQNVP